MGAGPASAAHCFYCFEVLAAHFREAQAPTLDTVAQLWEEYEASTKRVEAPRRERAAGRIVALRSSTLAAIKRDAGYDGDVSDADDDDDHSSTASASSLISSLRSSGSSRPLSSQSSMSSLPMSRSASATSASSGTHAKYPVYVTWNTSSAGRKSLRGCIGTFEAKELPAALREHSLTSALEDYRFPPVAAGDLPGLGCELTLLADFEPCADPLDWTLGTHGLRMSFSAAGRRYAATYLPQVCASQGWSKEACLESLMAKAGWQRAEEEEEEEENGDDVDDDDNSGAHLPAWQRVRRYSGPVLRQGMLGGRAMRDNCALTAADLTLSPPASRQKKPWEMVEDLEVVRYKGFNTSATYDEWQRFRRWAGSSLSASPQSQAAGTSYFP